MLRAALVVLALYAFLLLGFLGGLMPVRGALGGLCAGHATTDQTPGNPVAPGHGDCCAAAQAVGSALPPRSAPQVVAWALCSSLRIAPPRIVTDAARSPPGRIAEPRGPPTA